MDKLRTYTFNYVQQANISWYQLAQKTGIMPQILYRFRNGGDMNGENSIRLALFLNLTLEDLK